MRTVDATRHRRRCIVSTTDTPPLSPDEEDALAQQYDLAFGRHQPPTGAAPTEAEVECNRLLSALKDVRDEQAANQRLRDEEVSSADRWLARVNETPHRKEAWILLMLEAVAPFVPRYGGKKSRELPRGVIGWRLSPERLTVDDPAAATAWAKAVGLPTETVETVKHKVLVEAWKEAREGTDFVPPGCRVIEEEEQFYIKPLGVS